MRSSLFNYPLDLLFHPAARTVDRPHFSSPAHSPSGAATHPRWPAGSPRDSPATGGSRNAQRLDVLFRQKFFTPGVALQALRQTVLGTVQLHRQPRRRTIEIQNVITHRMLPAKLETREPMTTQRPPQIPFRVRLVTTKLAGGGDRVHTGRMQIAAKNSSRSLLLPRPSRGAHCCGNSGQYHFCKSYTFRRRILFRCNVSPWNLWCLWDIYFNCSSDNRLDWGVNGVYTYGPNPVTFMVRGWGTTGPQGGDTYSEAFVSGETSLWTEVAGGGINILGDTPQEGDGPPAFSISAVPEPTTISSGGVDHRSILPSFYQRLCPR